jgi:hypothetical protein
VLCPDGSWATRQSCAAFASAGGSTAKSGSNANQSIVAVLIIVAGALCAAALNAYVTNRQLVARRPFIAFYKGSPSAVAICITMQQTLRSMIGLISTLFQGNTTSWNRLK